MKKVYFDSHKCLGCRSCEFACALEHSQSKDPARAMREADRPVARRCVQWADGMVLTLACRHCRTPSCVDACIAGAMTKDPLTGQVSCDPDKCIGCWMCVMVCPFDAIKPGQHFSIKCDLCPDRGTNRACVEACPTRALFEASPEEMRAPLEKRKAQPAKKLPLGGRPQ